MKRQTRAEKEASQKAALQQRIEDIYSGARGQRWEFGCYLSAKDIQQVMMAIDSLFVGDDVTRKSILGHWNVDEYDNPTQLTDFLFDLGVRA